MSPASIIFFFAQLGMMAAAFILGRRLARAKTRQWKPVAVATTALCLLWPVMRFKPLPFLQSLGADVLMHIEVTGICVPATLMFAVASVQSPTASMRRLTGVLVLVIALYFVRFGRWMVTPPPTNLGATILSPDGVCMQSTDYTCVAASMVTLLHAWGITATETEMARLSRTDTSGTTDIRALAGLQHKLNGSNLAAHYDAFAYDDLMRTPMPCIASIDWGYTANHMVAIMKITEKEVTLGDPLESIKQIPKSEFLRKWNGRAIFIQPVAEHPTNSRSQS